jgi:drug/metabolite transporter (DMT)-like permease
MAAPQREGKAMRDELRAGGLVLAAMAVIGLIDQFVRGLSEASSLWTFHLIRSAMIWGLALAVLAAARRRLRVRRWRGVAARAGVMSLAMMIYFGSLGFMPVAQAAAGLFTAPIWVALLSPLLAGRAAPGAAWAAAGLGFAGVVLVLAPDPSAVGCATMVPVASGLFYAVAAIATRAWCPGEGAVELSLAAFTALGLWGLAGALLLPGAGAGFLDRGWVAPSGAVLAVCAVQAAGSLGAVVMLTRAYQLAEAGTVAVVEYSVLGFSALFGWLLLGEALGPRGLAGLALIAAAGALALRPWRRPARGAA